MERLQSAFVHDLIDIVFVFRTGHKIVLAYRFPDDLTDRKSRRKAGEGILEDDLHMSAHLPHFLIRKIIYFFAVEQNLSGGLLADQSEDCSSRRGLSASRLSDKTHCRAALQVERHSVNSLDMPDDMRDDPALNGEVLLKIIDHQDVLRIISDRLIIQFFVFMFSHYSSSLSW